MFEIDEVPVNVRWIPSELLRKGLSSSCIFMSLKGLQRIRACRKAGARLSDTCIERRTGG